MVTMQGNCPFILLLLATVLFIGLVDGQDVTTTSMVEPTTYKSEVSIQPDMSVTTESATKVQLTTPAVVNSASSSTTQTLPRTTTPEQATTSATPLPIITTPVATLPTTVVTTVAPETTTPRPECEEGELTCTQTGACVKDIRVCNFKNDCGGPGPGEDEENCTFHTDFEGTDSKHGWGGTTFARYFSGQWMRVQGREVGVVDHTISSPNGYVLNATVREASDESAVSKNTFFESAFDSPLLPTNSTKCSLRFSYYINRTASSSLPRLTAEILYQTCESFLLCLFKVRAAMNLNAQFTRDVRFSTRAASTEWSTVQFPLDPPSNVSLFFVRLRAQGRISDSAKHNTVFLDDLELIDCEPPRLMDETDCRDNQFYCRESMLCIDNTRKCDIRKDCRHGEDEDRATCRGMKRQYRFTRRRHINNLIQFKNGYLDNLDWEYRSTSPESDALNEDPHTKGLPFYDLTQGSSTWYGGYVYVRHVLEASRQNFTAVTDLKDVLKTKNVECHVVFHVAFSSENQDLSLGYRMEENGKMEGILWRSTNTTYMPGVWHRQIVRIPPNTINRPFRLSFVTGYTGVALDAFSIEQDCFSVDNNLPVAATTLMPATHEIVRKHCAMTQIYCASTDGCLPIEKRCNFNKDCADGTDEMGCVQESCTFDHKDACGWRMIKPVNVSLEQIQITHPSNQWAFAHAFSADQERLLDHTTNSRFGYYLALGTGSVANARQTTILSSGPISESGPECSLRLYFSIIRSYSRLGVDLELAGGQAIRVFSYRRESTDGWQKIDIPIGSRRNFTVLITGRGYRRGPDEAIALDDLMFLNCTPPVPSPTPCSTDQYRCDGGSCISSDKVCDIRDDCGDRSDELEDYCAAGHQQCTFEPPFKCKAWNPDPDAGLTWSITQPKSAYGTHINVDHTILSNEGRMLRMRRNYDGNCSTSFGDPPEDYGSKAFGRLVSNTLSGSSHDCKLVFYYHAGELLYTNATLKVIVTSLAADTGFETSTEVIYSKDIGDNTEESILEWQRTAVLLDNRKDKTSSLFRVSIVVEVPKYYKRFWLAYSCSFRGLSLDDIVLSSGCKPSAGFDTAKPQFAVNATVCGLDQFLCPGTPENETICIPAKEVCNFQQDCPMVMGPNGTMPTSALATSGDEAICGSNCTFDDTLCGWKLEGITEPVRWQFRDSEAAKKWGSRRLAFGNETCIIATGSRPGNASFESLIYQPPPQSCFIKFRYLMKGFSAWREPRSNVTFLQVLVKPVEGEEIVIANLSLKHTHNWLTSVSPLNIQVPFIIRFQVEFIRSVFADVAIDDITFVGCDGKQTAVSCASEQFSCHNKLECIQRYQVCDFMTHCEDGSDEDPEMCENALTRDPSVCRSEPLEPHQENCIWGCQFDGISNFGSCQMSSVIGLTTDTVWEMASAEDSPRRRRAIMAPDDNFAAAFSSEVGDISELETMFTMPAAFDYCRTRFWFRIDGDSTLRVTIEDKTGNRLPYFVHSGATDWQHVNLLVGARNDYHLIWQHISGVDGAIFLDNVTLTQECFKQDLRSEFSECFSFKCAPTQQCMPASWLCDGQVECPDGTDEVCTVPPPITAAVIEAEDDNSLTIVLSLCGILILTIGIILGVILFKRRQANNEPINMRDMFRFEFTKSIGEVTSNLRSRISGNRTVGDKVILTNEEDDVARAPANDGAESTGVTFSSPGSNGAPRANGNRLSTVTGLDNPLYQTDTTVGPDGTAVL